VIFLLEYDRARGKLLSLRAFGSEERPVAQDAKLELELQRNKDRTEAEVVLLDADSEEDLRKGYRRYFEDMPTLLQTTAQSIRLDIHTL